MALLLTAARHTHLGKHKAEVAVTTRLKSAFIRKKSNEIETRKKNEKKNRSQTVQTVPIFLILVPPFLATAPMA